MICVFKDWEEDIVSNERIIYRKYFSNGKLAADIFASNNKIFDVSTYFSSNADLPAPKRIEPQTSIQAAKDIIDNIFKDYNIKELPSHYKTLL